MSFCSIITWTWQSVSTHHTCCPKPFRLPSSFHFLGNIIESSVISSSDTGGVSVAGSGRWQVGGNDNDAVRLRTIIQPFIRLSCNTDKGRICLMITVINEKPQMCFTIVTERFISFSYSDDERCIAVSLMLQKLTLSNSKVISEYQMTLQNWLDLRGAVCRDSCWLGRVWLHVSCCVATNCWVGLQGWKYHFLSDYQREEGGLWGGCKLELNTKHIPVYLNISALSNWLSSKVREIQHNIF